MAEPIRAFQVAKVLIVNPAGEILALRRSNTDTRRPGQWDFPGGLVEPGEDVATAAAREAFEEAGIAIVEPRLAFAMSAMRDPGAGTWLLYVSRIDDTPEVTLSFEHDAYRWVRPAELLPDLVYDKHISMVRYILDNKILDAHEVGA